MDYETMDYEFNVTVPDEYRRAFDAALERINAACAGDGRDRWLPKDFARSLFLQSLTNLGTGSPIVRVDITRADGSLLSRWV